MQEIKVVARTFETAEIAKKLGITEEELNDNMKENMTLMSGKAAGICYMPDNYLDEEIQNEEKAFNRANMTFKSGHHSVYDHAHITMTLKTNKMIAMILNSLGVYATSEKSARYTKMKPETELEIELYNKWLTKIQKLILTKYPDTDDDVLSTRLCKKLGIEKSKAVINGSISHIKDDEYMEEMLNQLKTSVTLPSYKLAQENARYMISVFTSTTMEYTVSFRQLELIINYMNKLVINLENATDKFSKKLQPCIDEFYSLLVEQFGPMEYWDHKNQYIRFLEAQNVGEMILNNGELKEFITYKDLENRLEAKKTVFGDSYTTVYTGSLAMIAQAQRHRTLRYTICLQEPGENGFYVPEIVKDAGLSDEWLHDINSVAYCVPQGTVVRITEQGLFEDFVLKCKERLCGKAQLEVMKQSTKTMQKFIDNMDNLSYSNKKLLETATMCTDKGLKPCARCVFKDFQCSEGCKWGAKEALTRLI